MHIGPRPLLIILGAFIFLAIAAKFLSPQTSSLSDTVVIVVDGFSSEYLNRTPLFENFSKKWAGNASALTVYPSITPAAHTSILTGKDPVSHGIQNYGARALYSATIMDWFRERGAKTCFVYAKGELSFIAKKADYVYEAPRMQLNEIDSHILSKALELRAQTHCNLMVVSIPATDVMGHKYGPDSPQMGVHLKSLDSSLAIFFERAGDCNIILTSDHGMCRGEGGGYHGTNESCAMIVPLFVRSELLENYSFSSIKDVHRLIKLISVRP